LCCPLPQAVYKNLIYDLIKYINNYYCNRKNV